MSARRSQHRGLPRSYLLHLITLFLGLLALMGGAFAGSVNLAWDAVSGASGYRVYYGTTSATYTANVDAGSNTSATVAGLTDGATYYFAVKAYAGTVISDYSNEVSMTIQALPNQPPTANAGPDQTVTLAAGQTSIGVTLNGSGSSDPDGTIVSYNWTGTPDPANTVSPTVTLAAGSYTFSLVVTDNNGATSTADTVNVTVRPALNQPPTANAGPDQTVTLAAGQTSIGVTLNGSGSSDPDGTIVSYNWTGTPDPANTVSPTVTLAAGSYTFSLVVTDNNGATSAADTVNVTVKPALSQLPNQPPTAKAGPDKTVTLAAGTTSIGVTLDGSGSSDPDGTIVSYNWAGTPDPANTVSPSVTLAVGTYTFTLVVTDNNGATSAADTLTVEVDLPMEVGELLVNDEWQRVDFQTPFTDPIVVANPLSGNDGDPAVVRVYGVDPEGFWIRVQEWDYLDGKHPDETVSYVAMERGRYQLPDGAWVEAGRRAEGTTSFTTATFSEPFAEVPVVLSTVTSVNEADAVVVRMRRISVTGFEVRMDEQQANTRTHLPESIDYIAWEPSFGVVNGLRYEVGRMDALVTDSLSTLVYQAAFAQPPMFLADMQTTYSKDPANLRWRNRNEVAVEVWVSEEQSADAETAHLWESVGYFAADAEQ